MTEWNYSEKKREKFIITVGEKNYEVYPYLSISDLLLVSGKLQEGNKYNYRMIVAELIANHARNAFKPSEIIGLDDNIFEKYIDICIISDSELKENYDSLTVSYKYKRFILAVDETSKQLARVLSAEINVTISPLLSKLSESSEEITNSLTRAIQPAIDASETIAKITSSWQTTWQSAWTENLKQFSNVYVNVVADYSEVFSGISSALQELVKNIHIPSISEERKTQLIQSYKAWGQLGWTVPFDAELNVFNTEPESINDAYYRLHRYFNDSALEELFDEIRKLKHIKKTDFDEAVCCFRMKNYKACALILFALIDSRLIRSQHKEDRNSRTGMRQSGRQAAKKLFDRIESKYLTQEMLFSLLDQVNILAALKTVFEGGNDFRVQPKVINRNFLDHGMLHRKVTRKDCIMLFLLLYNLTDHLNCFLCK